LPQRVVAALAACCALHVARCMLRVVAALAVRCCVLRVACCVLCAAKPRARGRGRGQVFGVVCARLRCLHSDVVSALGVLLRGWLPSGPLSFALYLVGALVRGWLVRWSVVRCTEN
jgi:hypothetical protein